MIDAQKWTILKTDQNSLFPAPNVVMSAAHCIQNAFTVKVLAGAHDRTANEASQQELTATRFQVHEDWHPLLIDNDIALVFLDEDFEMNDDVQAIERSSIAARTGDDVTATGWGKTCDGVSRLCIAQSSL